MTIETDDDFVKLQHVGNVVARCMHHMADAMEPGMTTAELDDVGARFLELHGARSAPKVMYGFPGTTCISVNEDVAHGIPGERKLQRGDLVNIDVSAEIDGIFADTGGSFAVVEASPRQRGVCDATREALGAAMREARDGVGLIEIGRAVERVARRRKLRIIKELCSHGVGRALHEEPDAIKSYVDPRERRRFTKGLVITLEPFLTTGTGTIREGDDGWTLSTSKGVISAQFEHTMVITEGAPIVVTRAA